MEKAYWLKKWEQQDIAFHQQETNHDLIAHARLLNLKPGDYILVPLCGKTKDMLWLADKGYKVTGIEVSPIACHDFFAELNIIPHITKQGDYTKFQHDNIELLCGDLFALTTSDLPKIHAIYDCKALIAFPPDMRRQYVNHLVSCLGTKLNILLLTREFNCEVEPPPFSVDHTEVNLLYGHYFGVKQLKNNLIKDISERLIRKGYTDMREGVYLMSEKETGENNVEL